MEIKPKIICVDDEEFNLTLFEMKFRKQFTVLTAENGYKALEVLESNSDTEFILSDMKMPGMNGLELLNEVKSRYPQISCYLYTGYEITPEILSTVKKGIIERYFQKPLDLGILMDIILEKAES